jgi:hypothetical protein
VKALIVTPAYSHAHHLLGQAIARSGLRWLPLYEHSDLVRARSILLTLALREGADVLVLVDADVIPGPGVLEAVAAAPTPERAVFGIYTQRDGKRLSVEPLGGADEAAGAMARGEPFPIVFGGLGLVAIHAESLVRVAATLPAVHEPELSWAPFCLPFVRGTTYHGDDRALCARLRDAGVELVADPRLDVRHAVTTLVGRRGDL